MTDTTIAAYGTSSERITSIPARRAGPISRAAKAAGRDLVYLSGVLGSSILGFVVWATGVSVTVGLAVLAFGVLVWVPAAMALRGVANLDRGLVSWYRREPATARYRRSPSNGVIDRFKTAVTDPRIWADLKWVVLNSIFGFVGATIAISVTAEVVSLIATPLWWWAISDPHHQYATLNLGIYTVTSTGWALVTTGIGFALAPVALLINRGVASVHSRAARRLLADSSVR
jgi:type IV secretory pathway TrbD component